MVKEREKNAQQGAIVSPRTAAQQVPYWNNNPRRLLLLVLDPLFPDRKSVV